MNKLILSFLIVSTCTLSVGAKPNSQEILTAGPFQKKEIEWKSVLAELPDVQNLMVAFMKDKQIPLHLKSKLKRVLKNNSVEIRNFSDDIKEIYEFAESLEAFAASLKLPYIVKQGDQPTFNDQIAVSADKLMKDKKKEGWFSKDYFLMLKNGKIGEVENPILILSHELAHIRMHLFLNKHIDSLIGKFPPDWLYRDANGKIVIMSVLYSYIQERYAHEIEFQTLKAIMHNKNFLFDTPSKWINLKLYSDGMAVRTAIAQMIRLNYELKDERLIFMDRMRLHSVLTEGLDQRYWNFGQ